MMHVRWRLRQRADFCTRRRAGRLAQGVAYAGMGCIMQGEGVIQLAQSATATRKQTQTIYVELGSNIRIPGWADVRERFPALSKRIRADVTIPNPEYTEAKRLGRYTGGIRRHIHCYQYSNDTMTMPIGYLKQLRNNEIKS